MEVVILRRGFNAVCRAAEDRFHRFHIRVHRVLSWLERVALLRRQIVCGAATRGSRLNRDSLQRCRKVLETLLPVVLQLVMDHWADDDWPPLCYPPIRE